MHSPRGAICSIKYLGGTCQVGYGELTSFYCLYIPRVHNLCHIASFLHPARIRLRYRSPICPDFGSLSLDGGVLTICFWIYACCTRVLTSMFLRLLIFVKISGFCAQLTSTPPLFSKSSLTASTTSLSVRLHFVRQTMNIQTKSLKILQFYPHCPAQNFFLPS